LTQKAVELALAGNMAALKLCLERILPPRKMPPCDTPPRKRPPLNPPGFDDLPGSDDLLREYMGSFN
jgi:hypothetical protein